MNELLQSADPNLTDEDIDRAVGLLWVNAFACSNGGGQVLKLNSQAILLQMIVIIFIHRVAKCLGFWGLIRVKMFAGWNKNTF